MNKPELRAISGWMTEYRCKNCITPISFNTVMHSSGRCPCCGFKATQFSTVVAVTEHAYRLVTDRKWWQFWIKPTRQYLDEQTQKPITSV